MEEVRTFVGEWKAIHVNAIARLAERPETQQIDLLAAYRVGEIRNVIGEFKRDPVPNYEHALQIFLTMHFAMLIGGSSTIERLTN